MKRSRSRVVDQENILATKGSNSFNDSTVSSPSTTRRLRSRDGGATQKPIKKSIVELKNEQNIKKEDQESISLNLDLTKSLASFKTNGNGHHYGRIKRIKLNFTLPERTVTHPDQVAIPKFKNLHEYLNSFKYFLDNDLSIEEYNEKLQEEIELVVNIRQAIKNQVLKVDPVTNKIVKVAKPKPFVEPFATRHTHQDHLVAHAMRLSKIMQENSRSKIAKCRKIAQMVDNHFKKKGGEKDREIKEHHRKMKKLARDTITMVKRRWKDVEKAYRIIEDKKREQEKIEEGRKTMNKMVMDSSLRAMEHVIGGKKAEEESDLSDDEVGDSSEEESDMDMSAISEGEEEQDGNKADLKLEEDDSKLTQLELQRKYAFLESYEPETGPEMEAEESDSDDEKEIDEQESVEVEDLELIDEKDIERYKQLEKEDHDSLLDSDESLSDSEDSSEASGDESEGEQQDGLASLFGQTITKDESDEEEFEEKVENDNDSSKAIQKITVEKPITEEEPITEEVNGQIDTDKKDGEDTPESKEEDPLASIPDVPVPALLRGTLRAYQKQGLNWLANLYNNNTNGILADEMGLGKTIQTISLISYLACEKHIWGPHLIVVPTSVMLNWEMEFKRFAPGFKVMTYYGSPQQRKEKRKGWNKPDAFHVCITSYQLVCHDQLSFRRKKWEYMVLDEAHNIKNFRTTRWQSLLNFNTNRRLLLTGTPLQNNLAELWSLLYFLMPSRKNDSIMPEGFASLDDFQQWFGRPVDKIIEGGAIGTDLATKETISKLHKVLRPYLLRRLKADVEKQMPGKYEHIVYCRLSKRQRFLYDDFMSRAQTKETLASGNFLSIINCLMQLRKVCNHPDLFEVRPIVAPLAIPSSVVGNYNKHFPRRLESLLDSDINHSVLNLHFTSNDYLMTTFDSLSTAKLNARVYLSKDCEKLEELVQHAIEPDYNNLDQFYKYFKYVEQKDALDHSRQILYINDLRCAKFPVYGQNLVKLLTISTPCNDESFYSQKDLHSLEDMIKPLSTRALESKEIVERYAFVTPPAYALDMKYQAVPEEVENQVLEAKPDFTEHNVLHQAQVQLSMNFPDKSLLLYDSGKLQKLAKLLRDLKNKGHRALIFTQMTKVLDILEKFLNGLGYLYSRLDGATKIEDRQLLTEKFNKDPRITCFILSTRSGGLGINLTGADTVIFYDNDWNPAMDKQCQDRCHRIGQTRDVHIYRFVSEHTIEENIMRKSNYKRKLDNVVIQDGDFTTDYFGKLTLSDLLGGDLQGDGNKLLLANGNIDNLAKAEDEEDAVAVKEAMKEARQEIELDANDFDENAPVSTDSPVAKSRSNTVEPIGQENLQINEVDDDIGHIDEYMLRFIQEGYYF